MGMKRVVLTFNSIVHAAGKMQRASVFYCCFPLIPYVLLSLAARNGRIYRNDVNRHELDRVPQACPLRGDRVFATHVGYDRPFMQPLERTARSGLIRLEKANRLYPIVVEKPMWSRTVGAFGLSTKLEGRMVLLLAMHTLNEVCATGETRT